MVVVPRVEEPRCRHPGGSGQPASACTECRPLADAWTAEWDRFVAENPDHPMARQAVRYREAH